MGSGGMVDTSVLGTDGLKEAKDFVDTYCDYVLND